MAIIYTYPRLTNPNGSEVVTVSDTNNNNATRSVALSSIAALVPSTAGGTVTSVGFDPTATGLTETSGTNPINTFGTFVLDGTLYANHGGTGQAAYAAGDILYYDTLGPQQLDILNIGAIGEVLTVSAGGLPVWNATTAAPVTSVTGIAPGTQAGTNPITVAPLSGLGAVTIQSLAYAGDTRAGHVPGTSGGSSSVFLDGAGGWGTPTLLAMTTATLGSGKLRYTYGATPVAEIQSTTANRTYGVTANGSDQLVVNVPWSSLATGGVTLSGDTVISVMDDDLTFTATTGDVKMNNDGFPNPSMTIAGASNNITMGEFDPAVTDEQLIINNDNTGTNTTCLKLNSANTTGGQKGADIELSGASTINTGISIASSGATRNFALTTTLGNSGFGTATPDDSVMIEMSSTLQGFLPPRMTTAQMNAIVTPAKGLMVYDTDTDEWKGNNGTPGAPTWVVIG